MSSCNSSGKKIATGTARHLFVLFVLVVILCSLAQCVTGQDIAWKIVTDVAARAEREGRFVDAEVGYKRALDLVRKSAGPASPDTALALNNLAVFYHARGQNAKGLGVKQDYTEAFKWYTLAAQKGNALAQNNLGYAYLFMSKDMAFPLIPFKRMPGIH